jgi:heavy metal sensor kinase
MLYGKTRKSNKSKLSDRLARTYAALFAGTLMCISIVLFVSLSSFLMNRQKNYIINTIELVSDHIVEEIYEGDELQSEKILSEFNINWNLNMFLSDPAGHIINRVRNFNVDETKLAPAAAAPQLLLLNGKQLILCYSHPVADESTTYGSLYFVLNMQTELDFLKILAVLLAGANLLGAIASLCVGWATSKKMLAPIDNMISAANTINSQRLSRRLDVPGAEDELQKLAVTINSMLDRVEEAFRLQGQFTADASHELRTPLAILQGNADMLERWGRNDPVVLDESIASIQRQTRYMNQLVDNLLFLARGDSGKRQLKKEAFDISALLNELVEEQSSIDESHRYEVDSSETIRLFADRNMVKQLLRALIDNSVKYTPVDGKITLSCRDNSDGISVSVADTGIGMKQEHLSRVFERFYRADQARSKATGGMGLGLSIVQAIVDVHGGKLFAESEAEKGTCITAVFLK